jgi:hypothetical protein
VRSIERGVQNGRGFRRAARRANALLHRFAARSRALGTLAPVLVVLCVALFAFCAAITYAAFPRTAEWLTMGGGLTRGLGELFALLAMWAFVRAVGRGDRTAAALAGVFAGLAALSHLEAGLLAASSLIVMALFLPSIRSTVLLKRFTGGRPAHRSSHRSGA